MTGRAGRLRSAVPLTVAVLAALLAALAAASATAAPLGEIHSFPLAPGAAAQAIVAGPEGDMWFTEPEAAAIGRITPAGTITEFKGLKGAPDGIALGPEGNLWFADVGPHMAIGRITPAGEITEFSEGLNYHPYSIARGAEGDLWFTTPSTIGRITPAGQITEYKKGVFETPGAITAGGDGNLWFTVEGTEPAIGRVTPAGEVSEYPIAHKWLEPNAITEAADGSVAFTTASGDNEGGVYEAVVGLVTPAGKIYLSPAERLDAIPAGIATGPDGQLWFAGEGVEPGKSSTIGRVSGELKPEEFPNEEAHYFTAGLAPELEPEGIAPGPDASMWFTNKGQSPAIRWIGTGAPAAAKESPVVAGPGEVGATLTCENAVWNSWAGQQPTTSGFGLDGYTWLLDGAPIAGQSSPSLTVTAPDAGHQISCSVRATYPLLSVVVSATSPAVTIIGPPASTPAVPALLRLPRQSQSVSRRGALHLTLDCSGAPCSGSVRLLARVKERTGKGAHRRTRTVSVTIATASFTGLHLGADSVALKLTSRGLGLLERGAYRLTAPALVSYLTSGSTRASLSGTVELKGTKPKAHR